MPAASLPHIHSLHAALHLAQFPKIKALDLKNDASITTKSSWELSGEQESSTTFSESHRHGDLQALA